jgi:type I restriction enzyme S subunit
MIKYDNYKPSGIEFFEHIPNDWEVKRLKDFGTFQNGVSKGKEYFGFGSPFVSYGNIYNNTISIDEINKLANSSKEDQKLYSVKEGDVFFTRTSETIDEIGIASTCQSTIETATFSGFVIRFRQNGKILLKEFSNYYFKANTNRLFLSNEINIVTRASLSQGVLGILPVIIPSKKQQTQIANYLDTKTQAIDKKINLLTQKANYYKEYKKSIINETVCKGLDKNVKLKDSGIEWISQIPEHWEVKRFKDVCFKNTTGGTPSTSSPEHFYGNNTWVTIADLGNDKFVETSKLGLTDEAIKLANIPITPKGSLIYSFKLTVGKIAFAKKDLYTNEALISIMPNKKIDLEYCYFMLPMFLLMNATENIYGAKMLNQKLIANTILVYPPLIQQIEIANYLNNKTQTIDKIITNINTQIATLKELRKTLINDVVTGKIKVVD